MKLLAISLDDTLAKSPGSVPGDSLHRNMKYARILDEYLVVVRTLEPLPQQKLAENIFVYPTNSSNRLFFIRDAYRIALCLMRERSVDVVYAADPFATALVAYLLKRKLGVPFCVSFAGDMIDNAPWLGERPLHRALNALGKWLIRRADSLRVVSALEAEKLKSLGIPEDRIWNLGWITDFECFRADGSAVRRSLLAEGEKMVLFVGRLVGQKNLPNLLRAVPSVLRSVPNARFVFVGDGEKRAEMTALAETLGISAALRWVGEVEYERVPEYYAACDLLVLSSAYEGNARVLAEAAAAGKPVVSTDISGTRDTVLDSETGIIVPPDRPDALAGALVKVLSDPALAAGMGKRAASHVRRIYDEDLLLEGFSEMWRATAAGAGGRG